jgi:hypothetical protein
VASRVWGGGCGCSFLFSLELRCAGSSDCGGVLEHVFRPMWLRPMWPMYGTYIATLLGLALLNRIINSSTSDAAYVWIVNYKTVKISDQQNLNKLMSI